jgi:hypothetical protein
VVLPKDLLKLQGLDLIAGWGTGIATALTSPTFGFGVGLALYFLLSLVKANEQQKQVSQKEKTQHAN